MCVFVARVFKEVRYISEHKKLKTLACAKYCKRNIDATDEFIGTGSSQHHIF